MREKAALSGGRVAQVARNAAHRCAGSDGRHRDIWTANVTAGNYLQLPRALRSVDPDLLALRVKTGQGDLIPLSEIGHRYHRTRDQAIFHKICNG